MSYFPEMEWSTKWDMDNFVAFGSKAIESPKKLQLGDWSIVDNGEIDIGSFNQSGGGGNSGASGSDGGYGSSSKSFLSASTDSHGFITFEGSSGNLSKKIEMKGTKTSGTSPQLNASIGSMEPLMGLKLGKRTYFENSSVRGNVKNTFHSVVPAPSTTAQKKTKSSAQNSPIPRCQVLGCNVDLSTAKEYHRKHKVCDIHSKCPKVIVGGHERRFCQQCSRFHNLSEFDEKKRSCRHRLSDHNARRRKPHQEAMHFNSMRLSSPLYGGMQQMGFLFNNSSVINSKTPARSAWDSTFNSKFTLTKGYSLKSNGNLDTDEHFQVPGIKLPPVINRQGHAANGFLVSRNPPPDVLSRGSKGSLISSHLDAAPQNGRALSLLSNNNFWGPREPESVPVCYQNDSGVSQPMMSHAIREGTSLSTDFWQTGQHSTRPYVQPFSTNNNFQESQLFKPAYGSDFYSNMLN